MSTHVCKILNVNIRDEFHFSEFHRNMNAIGPFLMSLTLHKNHCIHTSMNVKKKKKNVS